jgi:hypothetical protein
MSCRKDRSPYEPPPLTNPSLDGRGLPVQRLSTLGFASGKPTPKIGQLAPAGRAPPTFDGQWPRFAAGITSGRLRSNRGIYRGRANGWNSAALLLPSEQGPGEGPESTPRADPEGVPTVRTYPLDIGEVFRSALGSAPLAQAALVHYARKPCALEVRLGNETRSAGDFTEAAQPEYRDPGIRAVFLFGSLARNRAHDTSMPTCFSISRGRRASCRLG